MNLTLLNKLVNESKLGKARIAERAEISRTTLDNALSGADIKISTLETLSDVLGVNPSVFFESCEDVDGRNEYEREIMRLQSLLDELQRKTTKVVIELDVTQDEFIKMGLKDKVIQVLER